MAPPGAKSHAGIKTTSLRSEVPMSMPRRGYVVSSRWTTSKRCNGTCAPSKAHNPSRSSDRAPSRPPGKLKLPGGHVSSWEPLKRPPPCHLRSPAGPSVSERAHHRETRRRRPAPTSRQRSTSALRATVLRRDRAPSYREGRPPGGSPHRAKPPPAPRSTARTTRASPGRPGWRGQAARHGPPPASR